MEGAVLGAAIKVLLQNLLSVSEEQISLVRDFRKDLKRLNESASMIQDFLDDAEKKQVTENAVKRWLKKLEGVAFDADNVLDELNYEDLSKKMETQNKIKKKASCFGLQMKLASAHAPGAGSDPPAGLETDSFTVDPIILGRENDVSRIVEMMTTSPVEQVFSILPIVGMGGLGKTTIKTHFEKHIWVHAKFFDVVILFNNILTSSTTKIVELGNKEAVLKKLQEDLGAKRYLLVLDDVWNDDLEKWDDFINSLSGISSKDGNGIIVTTRSVKVASIVKTLPSHELKSLSQDNCWSIIKAKAFRDGDIRSEFESIGKIIAKRCQGLPLAVKVVGGLLPYKSKDEWLSIEKNWLTDLGDENTISRILKLSFDRLSSPSLKKCFAYCSIFPKGFRFHREQLIELWMAKGFLQTDQRNDLETVGNQFFNLLLQNSLLQVVKKDTLRAVKEKRFEKNYLKKVPNTIKYLISLRHLHIPNIKLPLEMAGIVELGSLKNLKGKLEIHNLEKVHDKEEAKSAGLFQKSNIFKLNFNVLEGLQPHPNLKSLEIHRFKGRKCEEIPMLGHLPHPKSLYLCGLTNVRSIGSSFYGIDNCSKSRSSNNGVCKETIIAFRALERLELSRMSNPTEWVEVELLSAAETQLCEVVVFPCLEYLNVENCWKLMSVPSHFPCLKELVISEMNSDIPLANIRGIKLISLTKLTAWRIHGLVCLPDGLFYNNQNISKLTISDFNTISKWGTIDKCEGLTNLPREMIESGAASLESLTLYGLRSLTNLPMVIGCLQKMPCLAFLEILKLPKFTNFVVEIGSLRRLQKLRFGYSSNSWDYVSFKVTLDGIFQGLQSLRRLELWGMEHWDSLPDQLQHLTALSSLGLRDFGVEEALPEWIGNLRLPSKEAMQRLTKLTHLHIEYCPLLRWICIEEQGDDSEWPKISHIPNIYKCKYHFSLSFFFFLIQLCIYSYLLSDFNKKTLINIILFGYKGNFRETFVGI
ncbi:hypothetical protein Pfo_026908 [Paulownia fortunei]|nr:hypothetical protein Pfo_026908 [Paulownia fortunei]